MASTGLRELKKARTRRLIADTAARLFAERGYEHVAVSDVAREAEVAEQTVYNYFRTKEQLVTDRDQEIQDRLCDLIRSRPPTITPAAAIRDFVLESVAGIRSIPPEIWRGELGYLAAISPTVHRLALDNQHKYFLIDIHSYITIEPYRTRISDGKLPKAPGEICQRAKRCLRT